MKYTFDDAWIGKTFNGTKVDKPLAKRPHGVSQQEWYAFAGELCRKLNEQA